MDDRERLADLLARLRATGRTDWTLMLRAQAEMEDEILAAHRASKPRSRPRVPPPATVSDRGEPDLVAARIRWAAVQKLGARVMSPGRMKEVIERHRASSSDALRGVCGSAEEERQKIEGEICELASALAPEVSDDWHLVDSVPSSSYRTQPAAEFYAHGDAEIQALEFRRAGVPAEVRLVHGKWGPVYEAWARCAELDVEIVQRSRRLDVAGYLRECWRRGLNPRVLLPGLPAGLEEKLGVSYRGEIGLGVEVPLVRGWMSPTGESSEET